MNKEELIEFLQENLELAIRNDLRGNKYLVVTLEEKLIGSVNLESLFDDEPDRILG